MLIDLGEAEILEGHVAHAFEGGGGVKPARRDLFQQLAQTLLGHRNCSQVGRIARSAPARRLGL